MTRRIAALTATALLGFTLASAPARAEMSADAVKAQVETAYGVKVLRVKKVEIDDRAVYRVTVMYPGGNYNTAFQVNTLLVDAATGKEISTFRHLPSGHQRSGADTRQSNRQPPDVPRQRLWH